MSDSDVYDNEMPEGGFSDSDVERLLTGMVPEDPALARISPIVAKLQTYYSFEPLEEEAARFGEKAARIAEAPRLSNPRKAASRSGLPKRSFRRRSAVLAAAVAMLMATTGLALAADGSAPGDALYFVDRALESVGIADGGTNERIAEARALFDAGDISGALTHVAQAAEDDEAAASAAGALIDAAGQIRADAASGHHSAEVQDRVARLLEWMATTEVTGREFGRTVSEMARAINVDEVAPGSSDEDPTIEPRTEPGNQAKGNDAGQGSANQGRGNEDQGTEGERANRGSQGGGQGGGPPDQSPQDGKP